MTQVKICGLKYDADIDYVNEAMPDYAGFVIFEKSKRHVSVQRANELMHRLDPKIKRVAVIVSPSPDFFREVQNAAFDIIQIHGSIAPEVMDAAEKPIWQALNLTNESEIDALQERAEGIVVDSAVYGSGVTFDWQKAGNLKETIGDHKFILAGGLTIENIEEGISLFAPDIVDVSSGVEGEIGKDRDKIIAFVRKVRDYDGR